jgi:uncharacterized protein (UPF0216 family)
MNIMFFKKIIDASKKMFNENIVYINIMFLKKIRDASKKSGVIYIR